MIRPQVYMERTLSDLIDLVRDGYLSDTTVICKGGTIETNSILFSSLFPVVGKILKNTQAHDNTFVIMIPDIDSNHMVEFLMNVLLKSSDFKTHQSIVHLLSPEFSSTTEETYQEDSYEPEKPLKPVCINFVDPKKEMLSSNTLENALILSEDIKDEENDDFLDTPNENLSGSFDLIKVFDSSKLNGDKEGFICPICGKTLWGRNKKRFRQHVLQHKQKKTTFKCSECDYSFQTDYLLKRHFETEHTDKMPFKCNICSLGLKSERALKLHLTIVHGIRFKETYVCEDCGKSFKKKYCYQQHVQVHRPKQWKCEYCEKMFTMKTNLLTHVARAHEKSRQEVVCQDCGKSFKEKYYLLMHQNLTHLRKKTYKCTVEGCDEMFLYMRYRYYHLEKVHGIERNFKCRFECENKSIYKDPRTRNKHELEVHGQKYKPANTWSSLKKQ